MHTQMHRFVKQALRNGKRCVTIAWLSDVIQRNGFLPSWTVLYFPNMYLDTSSACKHGFKEVDKQMIKCTEANYTNSIHIEAPHLVSPKAD